MSCEKCSKCQLCEKSTHRTEEEKKNLNKRLNIIEGQVKGVKQMIVDNRYCSDILLQLSAISKAVESLESLVLTSYVENCVVYKVQSGNLEIVKEVMELVKRIK